MTDAMLHKGAIWAIYNGTEPKNVACDATGQLLTVGGSGPSTVTANQGTAAAIASAWPFKLTDGTDTLPIGPVTPLSGEATASGDTTVLAVAPGSFLRLFHVSFVPDPASSADVVVIIKIGTTRIYGWRCNKAGSGFSRSPKAGNGWIAGGDGEDLIINLSAAETVTYNFEYELV